MDIMKRFFILAVAVFSAIALGSCGKDSLSGLGSIEINGKKYLQSNVGLGGYWSDAIKTGELTVNIMRDDKYEGSYETDFFTFGFNNEKCPEKGDNLATMNLRMERYSSAGFKYNCEGGDLIVKSTNKKTGEITVQFNNLTMVKRKDNDKYIFNGTLTVSFDYYFKLYDDL